MDPQSQVREGFKDRHQVEIVHYDFHKKQFLVGLIKLILHFLEDFYLGVQDLFRRHRDRICGPDDNRDHLSGQSCFKFIDRNWVKKFLHIEKCKASSDLWISYMLILLLFTVRPIKIGTLSFPSVL